MLCLMGWALCLMAGAWVWHGSVCGWRACGGVAAVVATGVAARGRCWVMRLQNGWTAVMLAAQNGHESTAGLLLDRGADVEARTSVRLWCALQSLTSSRKSVVALPCMAFSLLPELTTC